MAVNNIYSTSSLLRFSGLASGLDTDSIIKSLMSVERIPLDKLYQKKQLAEWIRDDYRSITSLLRGFQSEFFDVLKPASNMRSESTYQKYTSVSSDSTVVTASGGAGLTNASHKIVINNIATAAKVDSSGTVSKAFSGSAVSSFEVNDHNNSFIVSYNGTSKTITLPKGTYADASSIVGNGSDGKLKQLLEEAFPGLTVSASSGSIVFTTANPSDELILSSNLVLDKFLSDLALQPNGTGSEITFPLDVADGRKFTVSITEGGVTTTKIIEWSDAATYTNSADLAATIQTMVDAEFGSGKLTVSGADGKLTFTKGEGIDSFTLGNSYDNNKVLNNLGFTSGDTNKINLTDTLEKVGSKLILTTGTEGITFDADGNFKLTINGKDITANKNETLSTLIYRINSSEAGVTISYSSFSDKFSIVAKNTGEGSITLNDNGSNFFANTKLTVFQDGTNASFTLDGVAGSRASNNFTIDGVTYNLLKADPGVEKTITLTRDTEAIFNTIKSFVEKYNELISKITTKLTEKYDSSFQPLTSAQKEDMSEDEIEKWENKAKTGLLRNDMSLSKMINDMRKAVYSSIDGVSGGLYSIGITTDKYNNGGKLIIDEEKLKNAIQNSPDQVMNIFAKESGRAYSADGDPTGERFKENGIINRLYDIIQDNIRTIRDSNGNKGVLLEKAGVIGDVSEFDNYYYDQIKEYNKKIDELAEKLIRKENAYYSKYTALEKYISQMNAQSNWLAMQLGQN